MLSHIHIENYALIRQSDIDFDGGFVAITGETGAGKSILLGAMSLLLGQRADSKVLLNPEKKCVVEALFDMSGKELRPLFETNDVDYPDDGSIIIRREILPSAKSRAFVNDTPVSVAFLRELGTEIIDIHSQHATLLLGDSHFQTSLLDSIGDNHTVLDNYRADYRSYAGLKSKLEQLTAQEQQNRKDYDYNKFLFDELANAALTDGEQEELEQESTLLANAEVIKQTLSQVVELCDGEEDSALSRLNASKSMVSKIAGINPQLSSLHERLESSIIELRDIVGSLDSINEEITFSPERQQQVDDRLGEIYRLEKKHGVEDIASLLAIQEELEKKLTEVDDSDRQIHEVMEAVDRAYKKMQQQADILTKTRRKAAETLVEQIKPLLADLGMPNANLQVAIEPSPTYGPSGHDNVTLLFNANKGMPLRELSSVASGGEMSRLMLAIKALTARASLLPTVIFDEIDSGISGDISLKVGRIMQQMSQSMQVIAITHLPQIAARASQHFKVYKEDSDGATTSRIRLLSDSERCHEIATMLSSDPPSEAALLTAKELMEM